MRACLIFIFLLAATFALSVNSKPHGKHHGSHKTSHTAKEKDVITEEANKAQISPTLVPFEASSQEQEDEELSSEDNANTNKEDGELEIPEKKDKSTAVLLSEEELVALLKKEAEEEDVEEDQGEHEEEMDEGKVEAAEAVEEEEKTLDDKMGENAEEEEVKDENTQDTETLGNEDQAKEVEKIITEREEQEALFEETDGSTESEIPVDLDYAADSSILQPLKIITKVKPNVDDKQPFLKTHDQDVKEKENGEHKFDDYDQDVQNTEAMDSKEVSTQENLPDDRKYKDPSAKSAEVDVMQQDSDSSTELTSKLSGGEAGEEEKSKNESESQTKRKTKKQKKNHRARKHSPQREETQEGQEQSQQEPQESEGIDNTVHKGKRRRAGKWGPLVGMNPVQIRATVELYPSTRTSLGGTTHHLEAPADPCDNFRCKRGKTCKLDADNKPSCVCQVPSECPPSVNEFDHVCGTDNKTYDTSCELFATKCNLEGTKKGHRLHLDYTGSCKLIPPCVDTELVQFPLRMRDWLKNVLLQLYEHDSMTPGFLTPKQRFRVKKIFENERRLHAGDHSVELLAQDFEKNYNMYIYPVHWQFAQLDQHPSDRLLSHSELAPLRVPLVPMEHCTSRFFQECDSDKDKQVSFKEWTSCFGIRDEDMDGNLLF
ncbi:SPARC-like protein 1 [Sphaeramia orbicularis]|uniref:SPARC-like protein 1 n=1 Tax=Sphaeramia orbicularis TaxID=375764 RepID=UPI00117F6D1B|nr:SPARC-like protein 1 [Sphaeramia orbicularis]